MAIDQSGACPCGSGRDYGSCCGPIHSHDAGVGSTAEQLMRARYSAYVLHDADFLLRSWHPSSRPVAVEFGPELSWHGLTIERTSAGGGLDHRGTVEFRARFDRGGHPLELHELSSFERVGGKWVYVSGADPGSAPGSGRG